MQIKKINSFFLFSVISILIFLLSLLNVNNSYAITKEECEFGGGSLIIPQISSPNEQDSNKNLVPYCSCETGFFWNDTAEQCQDDSQLRCIQTQGEWSNGACKCPKGTVKWTVGFGCDTRGPIPTSEIKITSITNYYFWGGLIIILIALFIFLYFKRRNKDEA